MKLIKYLYHALMIKKYVLNDGINTLAYFHKDCEKCDDDDDDDDDDNNNNNTNNKDQ